MYTRSGLVLGQDGNLNNNAELSDSGDEGIPCGQGNRRNGMEDDRGGVSPRVNGETNQREGVDSRRAPSAEEIIREIRVQSRREVQRGRQDLQDEGEDVVRRRESLREVDREYTRNDHRAGIRLGERDRPEQGRDSRRRGIGRGVNEGETREDHRDRYDLYRTREDDHQDSFDWYQLRERRPREDRPDRESRGGPSVHSIHVPKGLYFDGERYFPSFMTSFSKFLECHGLMRQGRKIMYLAEQCVCRKVVDFLHQKQKRQDINSWEEFEAVMKERFGSAKMRTTRLREFRQASQKRGEDARDFLDRLWGLADEAYDIRREGEAMEDILIDQFINGLQDEETARYLLQRECVNEQDLIKQYNIFTMARDHRRLGTPGDLEGPHFGGRRTYGESEGGDHAFGENPMLPNVRALSTQEKGRASEDRIGKLEEMLATMTLEVRDLLRSKDEREDNRPSIRCFGCGGPHLKRD